MLANNISPIRTADLQELQSVFSSLDRPYGLQAINCFNVSYKQLYPTLSPLEKHRAEELVDALIAGLEDRALADKIYGVF
jgi:hypothetical protein